mgnify:CR=1 FL=1
MNTNTNTSNDLFFGVFRRNGIRLISMVDGTVHFPWTNSDIDFIAFTSSKLAARFAANVGGEVWALTPGHDSSLVELSPDVYKVRKLAPLWAIK